MKKRTETIYIIREKKYVRIDGGEWTEEERKASKPPGWLLKIVDQQTEYKSLGTEVLNDRRTNVYAKIERTKRFNEEKQTESFSTITTKYWFGEDGGIIKQEDRIESGVMPQKDKIEVSNRTLRVTVWELDPTIRIEAPIIDKQ
jgi:hypothetical protein